MQCKECIRVLLINATEFFRPTSKNVFFYIYIAQSFVFSLDTGEEFELKEACMFNMTKFQFVVVFPSRKVGKLFSDFTGEQADRYIQSELE